MRIVRCDVCGKEYSDNQKLVEITSILQVDIYMQEHKNWSTGWGKFEVCHTEECINKGLTRHTQERVANMTTSIPDMLTTIGGESNGEVDNKDAQGS